MYHSIGTSSHTEVGAGLYCVDVENFRKQMEYIAEKRGVNSQWPIADSQRNKNYRLSTIDYRPVVITFDDGLLDNYTNAYPILKGLGLKAHFFILASKIGTQGFMDWGQIRELKKEGMHIGSHGMTHRILTELTEVDREYELKESKKILEDGAGCAIESFSIPRGFYNKQVIEKAAEAGYKAMYTSNPKDNDGCAFGRIAVKGEWDINYFIRIINRGLSLKDKAKELLKNTSKKLLGAGKYDKIRSRILRRAYKNS